MTIRDPTADSVLRACLMRSLIVPLLALACACSSTSSSEQSVPPLAAPVMPTPPGDLPAKRTSAPIFIRNATVMTANGDVHTPGYIALRDGKIADVGAGDKEPPSDATVIDAKGMVVTPGIIDTHSHMGIYPLPGVSAHEDGNEMTSPTTPEVWVEHGIWPQDPAFPRAAAHGVTTVQVLPGSANLIGGRSAVIKLAPATTARAMRFPGAKQGLKMACGENPKRVYGEKGQAPQTRMGDIAGFRAAFQSAIEYRRVWDKYDHDVAKHKADDDKEADSPTPPDRDLGLETLIGVLKGDILLHIHCYRADDMQQLLDVADEFGFRIRSFHHALEAYKIRDRLAAANVAVSTWADWWGFKMEAFDGIPHNAALFASAKGRAIIHSDSSTEVRFLNHEAAKARAAGTTLGLTFTDDEVLKWLTANPAWALGIEDKTGTLEVGKMADVVVWTGSPFSIYSRTQYVFIDGATVYDASKPARPSDFELGLLEVNK